MSAGQRVVIGTAAGVKESLLIELARPRDGTEPVVGMIEWWQDHPSEEGT